MGWNEDRDAFDRPANKNFEKYREALEPLQSLVDAAVAFAEQWEPPYRAHIFELALARLTADTPDNEPQKSSAAAAGQTSSRSPPRLAAELAAAEADTPIEKLAQATGVSGNLLKRAIHINDDNQIEILGRIDGRAVGELQNKYCAVYAYIKEQAYSEIHVGIEELRTVCKRHGCYDSSNFTRNFRNDSRLRELKGAGGRKKYYVATQQGLQEAAALVRRMAEG